MTECRASQLTEERSGGILDWMEKRVVTERASVGGKHSPDLAIIRREQKLRTLTCSQYLIT